VFSYPVELGDTWGDEELSAERKLPTGMRITINTPWVESMAEAELDINEDNLVFKYPETYYLDIKLRYLVDPDAGKAKFVKDKQTLTITLPILGLTEETKEELERQKKDYDEAMKKRDAMVASIEDLSGDVATFEMEGELEGEPDREQLKKEALEEKDSSKNDFLKVYTPDENKQEDEGPTKLDEIKYKVDEPEEDVTLPDSSVSKVTEISSSPAEETVIEPTPSSETVIAPCESI